MEGNSMATDVAKELSKVAKTWARTEPKKGGEYGGLDEGTYIVKIIDMKVGTSKSGNLQAVTSVKVKEPKEQKGIEHRIFHRLTDENGIGFFKGFAEVIGLEYPDDIEDLPDALKSFVEDFEDTLTIRVKQNGEFKNTTIVAVGDTDVDEDKDKEKDEDEDEDNEKENEDNKEEEDEEEEDKPKTKGKKKSHR
jgi:hypothetical protein